jgi:Fe-S cluster biogenesis protein NfuA
VPGLHDEESGQTADFQRIMAQMNDTQTIQIKGEPQADPNVCLFIVDRDVYAGGSHVCSSAALAQGSPLLEGLFSIEGVTQVWIKGHLVTVQKASTEEWPVLGKSIGTAVRAQLLSGIPFSPPVQAQGADLGQDARVQIQHVLDTQINPGVAGHGGKIELIDVRGTSVFLKMSGGCQGCGAAQMTLKQGVEKALRAQLPQITDVVDVTDHSSGQNPFYSAQPNH